VRLRRFLAGRLDWARGAGADNEPLTLLRRVIGFLMIGSAAAALLLAVTGVVPRGWILALALWIGYDAIVWLLVGILEPAIDFVARIVTDVGLGGQPPGFSEIESLVARGHYAFAADRYRERARRDRRVRAEAVVRRASLLAGPLGDPRTAIRELARLRAETKRLTPEDDILIGTTLAHLFQHGLDDPARAATELRRLIDQYPDSSHRPFLLRSIAELEDRRGVADSPI
jgi:hypothetical protein